MPACLPTYLKILIANDRRWNPFENLENKKAMMTANLNITDVQTNFTVHSEYTCSGQKKKSLTKTRHRTIILYPKYQLLRAAFILSKTTLDNHCNSIPNDLDSVLTPTEEKILLNNTSLS